MANDLISRGKLRVALNRENGIVIDGLRYIRADCVMAKLDMSSSVDAVPVVHSSWGYRAYRGDVRITVSGEAVCKKCHAPFFRIRGHWFKYCPDCGAKMDGGDGSE